MRRPVYEFVRARCDPGRKESLVEFVRAQTLTHEQFRNWSCTSHAECGLANYPWRTVTVSIEAMDPSRISHLQSFDPFPIPDASLPAPKRWRGPPRRWKKPTLTLLGTTV